MKTLLETDPNGFWFRTIYVFSLSISSQAKLVDVKSIVVPLNSLHLQINQINCSTLAFCWCKKIFIIFDLWLMPCLCYSSWEETKNAKKCSNVCEIFKLDNFPVKYTYKWGNIHQLCWAVGVLFRILYHHFSLFSYPFYPIYPYYYCQPTTSDFFPYGTWKGNKFINYFWINGNSIDPFHNC